MNSYDFEVVWLSSGSNGFPHADALWQSNPDLAASRHTAPDTGEDGWRNCDRNIRTWWKAHRETVMAERVLFLEWDVLVMQDLREVFPARRVLPGCEGAALRMRNRDGRSWLPFGEVDRLPEAVRPHAVGIAPLAVVMLSRLALDAVCDSQWDVLFAADIFSELRLATLVRFLGYQVQGNSRLADVTCGPSFEPGGRPGIFHPVKQGGEA